ncbi:MAG: hypothetical protein CML38_10900, partial [Rhodobacteraceae bacterium]
MRKKVLVVTGGAGNIGKETILLAKKAGYETFCLDLKRSKYANRSVLVDISREEEVEKAFKEIDHINALVCLAEINFQASIENLPWKSWQKLMVVNVRGAMLSLKYASPLFNKGSSIILASSLSENLGKSGYLAYQTSKGAILGLMRAASGGFVERDIRVNAICPGLVHVASNDTMAKIQKSGQEIMNTNKTGHLYKIAKPKEIAEGIMFLISDGSSF